MIDFVEAIKYQCKDSPFLGHCKPFRSRMNDFGWETYTLQGCREMEVHFHPDTSRLKVKGSLPYFIKGHNFTCSHKDFVEGVEVLQNLLQVPLWGAEVEAFEYGTICPVRDKPALYIRNHFAPASSRLNLNERGKDKGAFRWWSDSVKSLKLYDAGRNIRLKQDLKAREVIEEAGYDTQKNYIKFEVHHRQPFNLQGRAITLEDLQNPSFLNFLNQHLIEQYHQLQPMRTLQPPTDKKNLSALDIAVSVYVEDLLNQGIPVAEARKKVYQFINRAECLNQQDKDSRKATIRKAFAKLQESEKSQWDLTEDLLKALDAENKAVEGSEG